MPRDADLAQRLREFIAVVWDGVDVAAADASLAPTYTVHSDPVLQQLGLQPGA